MVGGRSVISALSLQSLDAISNIVADISALSVGTSFPIVYYLVEAVERSKGKISFHLFVVHDTLLDAAIQSVDVFIFQAVWRTRRGAIPSSHRSAPHRRGLRTAGGR